MFTLLHFREIFYVTEEMLCVPKLHVPIPTCMLRVVNNDTGEEIPRVFQKVAPYVYKRNKVMQRKIFSLFFFTLKITVGFSVLMHIICRQKRF